MKVFKNLIFMFILGGFIFSGITSARYTDSFTVEYIACM